MGCAKGCKGDCAAMFVHVIVGIYCEGVSAQCQIDSADFIDARRRGRGGFGPHNGGVGV